ncbi:DDE_Tnp_1_7 domain-containing protein [Trichonephila inaurata madagascariensis]|uniref:DDE_Tnp_1_7 domain-containing protein n=1 Tax=Trichonephila inaurata madagascariensis TaxID=2747483 RepID=A0A8X6X7Q3_9ARAC|nr:DDE_Tnp_1_7 domain-containing protein [Trichonephila inaurata madagascariensis]
MSTKHKPFVLLKHWFQKLHAPSNASDQSDPECELDNNSTHYSFSPAPSLGSIADLNISIYGPDSEDEQNASVSLDVTDEPDINLNSSVNSVPLTPILQEIDAGNYESVPSTLSAIASFPATPITPAIPITPDIVSRKKNTCKTRKTRSKKTNLPPAKRAKKTKRFQLTYKWKRASLSFRHRVVIEENLTDQENYIELPEEDASPMTFFQMFFSKDIVTDIVEQTNFYSVQETGKSIKLTENEFNDFLAIHIIMAYKGVKAGKCKQYMKDKLNKWGFKNYVRAGVSGTIYDFVMYGGEDTFRHHSFTEEESTLGFGAQAVFALCQSIHRKPATVYCDNFFSSPELFYILRENYGIFALGTIRNNRLRGDEKVIPGEKEMKKKEKGAFSESTCDNNHLAVVRWNDNKVVTFISTCVASDPIEKIQRYCKDSRKKVGVQCPQIVRQYKRHMGGVDLADMLISLYKIPFKSRRWYFGIFEQIVDICLNNAWLVYRDRRGPGSKIFLKVFRHQVYENLLLINRSAKRIKGEHSKINKPYAARPSSPLKYDDVGQ